MKRSFSTATVTGAKDFRRREEIELDIDVKKRAKKERDATEWLKWSIFDSKDDTKIKTIPEPTCLDIELFGYQKEWVCQAVRMENSETRGGILADEKGMGRVVEAISLVLAQRELCQKNIDQSMNSGLPPRSATLVICNEKHLSKWIYEVQRSTPKVEFMVYEGGQSLLIQDLPRLTNFDFVITPYSTIETDYRNWNHGPPQQKPILHQVKWGRIILDEPQPCEKTGPCSAAEAVLNLKSLYRWILSGTRVEIAIPELYLFICFLQLDSHFYFFCNECDCKKFNSRPFCYSTNSSCSNCNHPCVSHFSWWNKYIDNPTLSVDEKEKIICDKLKNVVIRRTKKRRDYCVPSVIVSFRPLTFDAREAAFYTSQYNKAQPVWYSSVETYKNVIRLQKAANHQYLLEFSASQQFGNAKGVCVICDDLAEDPLEGSCKHGFCRHCFTNFYTLGAMLPAIHFCPTCNALLLGSDITEIQYDGNEIFASSPPSIKNSIQPENFQTSTKIEALREEIQSMAIRDCNAKGIVFSQFTSFLDLIGYSLGQSRIICAQYDGRMTEAARSDAFKRFTEDSNCKIFLMNLKSGGAALNLTSASYVFLMDPLLNPALEWEALGRIQRLGQHKPIRIVRFYVEDTVEHRILRLQKNKGLNLKFQGSQMALGKLTDEDVRFLTLDSEVEDVEGE